MLMLFSRPVRLRVQCVLLLACVAACRGASSNAPSQAAGASSPMTPDVRQSSPSTAGTTGQASSAVTATGGAASMIVTPTPAAGAAGVAGAGNGTAGAAQPGAGAAGLPQSGASAANGGNGGSAGVGATPTNDCDRACLLKFMQSYLDAVIAHDPSKLTFSATLKMTDNGVAAKLVTACGRQPRCWYPTNVWISRTPSLTTWPRSA
jgi:hypothetical protein